MVESKKALPKEPRTVGVGGVSVGLGVGGVGGVYSSLSPPQTLTSPGRFGNNNNNVLYNRFNALSQYYNTQGQTDQYVSLGRVVLVSGLTPCVSGPICKL
jgi:hypothetical protein